MHHHDEEHRDSLIGRPLKITLGLVLVIMVAEVIGGVFSNSLALLSDAGHMLTDALALGLSACLPSPPVTRTVTYSVAVDGAVVSDVNQFADYAAKVLAMAQPMRKPVMA